MSQHNLSVLCCNLCCDLENSVTTLFLSILLISVSRHKNPCRDRNLSPQLEVCRNVGSFFATRPLQQVNVIFRDLNFLVATKTSSSVLLLS